MRIAFRQAAKVAAFFVAATLVAPATAAPTVTWTVDCTRGQSINRALAHAPPGRKLMIIVRGTCNESVQIDRDDVVLQGDSGVHGTIHGPDAKFDTVFILGSRIILSGLSVTGGQNGITAWGANNLSIVDSVIQDTSASGVQVAGSQSVWVEKCRIERNAGIGMSLTRGASVMVNNTIITGNAGAGLHLGEKSNVNATNNTISSNGSNGVQAFDGSHALLWNNTITGNGTNAANDVNFRNGVAMFSGTLNINGNQITNHPSSGVRASAALVGGGNNTITGNADGVGLWLASQLALATGNTISNNAGIGVQLNLNSTGQISGTQIQFNGWDGLSVQGGSKLIFAESASTSGGNGGFGLRCQDSESSVAGLQMLITSRPNQLGDVSPTCTGF